MIRRLVACCVAVLLVVAGVWFGVNGVGAVQWFRSVSQIRSGIITNVPLGSSSDLVRDYIKQEGFRLLSASERVGYLSEDGVEVGSGHFMAQLGGYALVFTRTSVSAYFAFDDSGHLIEVDVRKTTDGP
jgi:hypothetical protein